jgi:hypothetical protein
VGAAAVAEPAEPVDHPEAVEDDQAVLGGVAVREQRGGDLFRGQNLVVVEQPEQRAIAVGELPQDRQQWVMSPHDGSPPLWSRPR